MAMRKRIIMSMLLLVLTAALGFEITRVAFAITPNGAQSENFVQSASSDTVSLLDTPPSLADAQPTLMTQANDNTDTDTSQELPLEAQASATVQTHTEQEIHDFLVNHPFDWLSTDSYAQTPQTSSPYAPGDISADARIQALNALNAMRFIAGISSQVSLNNEYNNLAQAAALVNAVNNELDHYPSKPAGMSDELYQRGHEGASSSNLSWGRQNLASNILGYLDDSRNLAGFDPGHRRWCLDSRMKQTGFGMVGSYGAMISIDGAYRFEQATPYVAWPARLMPTAFFDTNQAWSISLPYDVWTSDLNVSLTRARDGRTWNMTPGSSSDGRCEASDIGYGDLPVVTFLPNNVDAYLADDSFDVRVWSPSTGFSYSYTVRFFDVVRMEGSLERRTKNASGSWQTTANAGVYTTHVGGDSTSSYDANHTAYYHLNLRIASGEHTSKLFQNIYSLQQPRTKVSWSVSNPRIASVAQDTSMRFDFSSWGDVSLDAAVRPLELGSANVTATWAHGSTSAELRVVAWDIAQAKLANIEHQIMTGKALTPKPSLSFQGKTLQEGSDYTLAYSNNVELGTASISITGKGRFTGTRTTSFKIIPPSQPMHRLYNPNSGEHFYTASAAERDYLVKVGWRSEGIGWYAPLSSISKTPVYRLYNPNAGDHHYTMSSAERYMLVKAGWRYEGIGWYSDDARGVPLYRQYNPNARTGTHNYTVNKAENDMLVRIGWRAEGIGWYGVKF